MAKSHLCGLDSVLLPDLGPTVVAQLVRMPVRNHESGLLRILKPVIYRVAIRVRIVPVFSWAVSASDGVGVPP